MRKAMAIDDLQPWIEARFDRSPGPGGQNVNKLATRATLLLDFEQCPHFSDPDKRLIRERLARRLARDGRLRVVSSAGRTQLANRGAAEIRLLELLAQATARRKPRTATAPSRASQRRRLQDKRRRGEAKRQRRGVGE